MHAQLQHVATRQTLARVDGEPREMRARHHTSSASWHTTDKAPTRSPYSPKFFAYDCARAMQCPSSTNRRMAQASFSASPDANPCANNCQTLLRGPLQEHAKYTHDSLTHVHCWHTTAQLQLRTVNKDSKTYEKGGAGDSLLKCRQREIHEGHDNGHRCYTAAKRPHTRSSARSKIMAFPACIMGFLENVQCAKTHLFTGTIANLSVHRRRTLSPGMHSRRILCVSCPA